MAMKRKLFNALKLHKFYTSRSTLHNWSPLTTAFNVKNSNKVVLNLLKETNGLFEVPELRNHEGFYALKERCILQTDKLINEAINPQRKRKIVEIFDELSDTLCKVADLAEFIRLAHPSAAYSKSAEIACTTVSSLVEKLNTNYELYASLKDVVENGDKFPTNEIDNHVARLFLFDFEQCGIHLPENERSQVVELNDTILHLGQHFVTGSSSPRIVNKTVLPERIRYLFSLDKGRALVSGLYADSVDPLIRECAYRIFLYPEKHQEYLLMQLLFCRNRLAQVCGFKTFSERALKGSLAETPETVNKFLNLLSEKLKPRAEEDFKEMNSMKFSELGNEYGALAAWDIPYYSHKMRKNKFNIVGNEYAPYFSLGSCMEGLNILFNSLYGISLLNVDMNIGESWAVDVHKLAVLHESEGLLGYIYCDLYERAGKPNQDCHFTIQGGKVLSNGEYQLPIVVLMMNLPVPKWSGPSLLSPGMVDNLFHEMGHAMHSMLARTQYQHVTGTRCSTDFAEVPSVLMEYFANDPRVLKTFARHFQTGEPMPEKMIRKLCASKNLLIASEMQVQLFYSKLDQIYHGQFPLNDTTQVLAETQNQYYGIPYVQNTAWQLRFSHLVGYGAKYYSYLMSKAVASWIWQTYFENDPLNRNHGVKFRHECLAHGGGKPPRKLIGDFLQREVTPEKLVDSLIREIDDITKKYEKLKLKKDNT